MLQRLKGFFKKEDAQSYYDDIVAYKYPKVPLYINGIEFDNFSKVKINKKTPS